MTRSRSIARKLLVLSLSLAPACVDGDEGLVDEAEARIDDEAEARIDDAALADDDEARVELDDFALVAPPPGTSVWSERIYTDGSMRTIMLHADLDGVVFVEELDPHEDPRDLAAPRPEPSAAAVCSDDAYSLQPYKWTKALQWSFHADSTPSGMNKDSVEGKVKAGMSHITSSYNSCGLSDAVSATHTYLGRKAKNANVDASGNCTTNDSVNTVSFGDLPKGTLGITCVWFSGSTAVNADIKLNKVDHSWTTSPTSASCSNKFSVEAVMTHEAGHAFGLGHVSESSHPNLTMSTQIGPCQNSESTLGRGDVLGLRARY